ncbi:hypothetical protein PTKIN_Ptkin01aG0367600 [Pterospermum kingtungense]
MDPRAAVVVEALIRVAEVELRNEREKTRVMEESLRADRAELEAKERERSMLLRVKDRGFAVKEAEEKLVADFLEAVGTNKSFDEKAAMKAIVALLGRDGAGGSDGGGLGGVQGGNTNHLEKTDQAFDDDEGAVMETTGGTNGDGK